MKKFNVVTVLVLTLLLCVAEIGVAYAGTFRIENDTSRTITKIYVRKAGAGHSNWGTPQNSHQIPRGRAFTLKGIPISSSNRYWDIRIVLSNGNSYKWTRQNLYQHDQMTIYSSGSGVKADWY